MNNDSHFDALPALFSDIHVHYSPHIARFHFLLFFPLLLSFSTRLCGMHNIQTNPSSQRPG
jgi:hypothetical protein